MKKPLDRNANTRVRIAFLFLFVFLAVLSVGAYFIINLGKLQESGAAHESQAALPGIAGSKPIEEALRRNPSNKLLQMTAMAIKAADETSVAAERLSNEVAPPALSKNINLGTASRADLEALGRDLKTAEANATEFMPRYMALIKAQRDKVEAYARSLRPEKDALSRILDGIDKQSVETTALTSRMLLARADYYRAYENYVAVLVAEFGAYKVVDGQFIFPLQRTVDRYNIAAHAMTVAAKRVADLEEERKKLMQSQREQWQQFINGE